MSSPSRTMRVSMVTFGIGENVVPLASALTEHATVQLLLPGSELAAHARELSPDLDVVTFSKPRLRQPLRQLRMCVRLVVAIRRFDPDVLHLQIGHPWFNLVLPVLRRPVLLLDVHDPVPHLGDRDSSKAPGFVSTLARRRAGHLLTHAEAARRELLMLYGISADDVDVVPLSLGPALGRAPAPAPGPVVLFFGRIWAYKGVDVLLRAVPAVVRAFPHARFVIAGRGESLDRYVDLEPDPEHIELESGHISADRREELFAVASVVVLPYREATSTGIIPFAYRHGVPVVASAVGGIPEVVRHGSTGLLVPPEDPDALGAALIELLEDDAARRRMGDAALAAFDELFAPNRNAALTAKVYRRAIAARRPRRPRRRDPGPTRDLPTGSTQRRARALS